MEEQFVTPTIPKTLDEALSVLDKMIREDERQYLLASDSEEVMGRYHHGFGTWLRNEWGLWTGGPLCLYFKQLGLWHADDVSGLILTSFWRQLHNQPLDVPGQVQRYLDYWKENSQCKP